MSKSTRANSKLPDDIHQYLLGADMEGAKGGSNDAAIQNLLVLMTKTLETLTETKGGASTGSYIRLEDCPVKRKSSSLESWLKEVILWDECHSGSGNAQVIGAKKYLKFLDSVYKSEDSELLSLVRVEFVENEGFDKKKDTAVKDAVDIIRKKLGKSDIEKCTDAWLDFINLKQEAEETASSYVTKFEKIESQLRNVKKNIPERNGFARTLRLWASL